MAERRRELVLKTISKLWPAFRQKILISLSDAPSGLIMPICYRIVIMLYTRSETYFSDLANGSLQFMLPVARCHVGEWMLSFIHC
jgi:hypothetical protein